MRATKLRHAPTELPVVQSLRMIAQAGEGRHSGGVRDGTSRLREPLDVIRRSRG